MLAKFLRGLVDMLRVIADWLVEFADAVLERAQGNATSPKRI
jgi:hypothetical protein